MDEACSMNCASRNAEVAGEISYMDTAEGWTDFSP
jgi:hypothetical protein